MPKPLLPNWRPGLAAVCTPPLEARSLPRVDCARPLGFFPSRLLAGLVEPVAPRLGDLLDQSPPRLALALPILPLPLPLLQGPQFHRTLQSSQSLRPGLLVLPETGFMNLEFGTTTSSQLPSGRSGAV